MGIRYYAYPVDAELTATARSSPRSFLGADPLMDAWGTDGGAPDMLYLDKCWSFLQLLVAGSPPNPPRPAHLVLRGDVVMENDGWEAYVGGASPEEVAAAAADLALLTDRDVMAMLTRTGVDDQFGYVMQYLEAAKHFTARLALDGRGLVYLIG